MPTRKKTSSATARSGINFTRDIVERANCVFQEIDQHNDLGNDAYIEFINSETATGCCIAVQVKSGASYVNTDGSGILKADKPHFEYWKSHSLPVCGIIFDPARSQALWCDITDYLVKHPLVIEDGPYQIPVPADKIFHTATFADFCEHFLKYKATYSNNAHFGTSLERFSPFFPPEARLDALNALFSFHRNRAATWCYLTSLLRSIEQPALLRSLIRALTLIPGHGDIWWHKENTIDQSIRLSARMFMQLSFGYDEVLTLLGIVDEEGFSRGTIGQSIHALINIVENRMQILRKIAFDGNISEDIRYSAVSLLVYYLQDESVEKCMDMLKEFQESFPEGIHNNILKEIELILIEHGYVSFY